MTKRKSCSKSYLTTLLTAGKTVSEIHYGPFSYAWWTVDERNINDQIKLLVPINLGMKTLTKLNGRDFIITVLEPDIGTSPGPRYQATCDSKHSEICSNSSAAITSLYQDLFGTKTKFSGPLIMGFDQQVIVEELLKNIQFQPFEVSVEKLRIIVFGIGVSKNQEWNYAGAGYQSSFIDNIGKKKFLYVQNFTDKKCVLTVYKENELQTIVCGKNPTDVWSKIDHKPEFDANKLFGIDNEYTQALIGQLRIPSCKLEEWNDVLLLQQIFEYHLKKRTKSDVNWLDFIENWKNQQSEIIELRTSLMQVYGSEYQINSRELCAWRTMLRHMGCVEITPYNQNQCEVRIISMNK
jgi:hypothetical protein